MKVDISKIALVVVMIAGIQTSVLYHRVNDLECQRDIYKSRYEDWEGVSKEIAEYADTLRDSLKARTGWMGSCWLKMLEIFSVQPIAPKSESTSAEQEPGSQPAVPPWKLM